ncbi:hypothetical protein VOLCADRAFT_89714 [Volvox carteri f. nagariensis]|uniref:S-acyltransferase n=1 Tax=Volvox carteri f. nagariensis TaxID=3068 RepID=D8TSG0_VOLCA|nr:uncharacterized protein VOLCADRAFT_89714 [Volvox carteri f. nagariensis]EFJ49363.1 hypothetical protein VOLCADRAFT_89714 [Volvox carteri f. nagariensis]|eukprot:XP_002949344.1 hypothetical protein VOLCADRAFT_89714 [Volvox carteri f. nagariensis]
MDLFTLTLIYLSATAFSIFILLFGESPIFKRTPIATLHWSLTTGLCDGMEWLVARLCGARGSKTGQERTGSGAVPRAELKNVAYLVMVVGGFALYWGNLFALLPNPWADEGHIAVLPRRLTGSGVSSHAGLIAPCGVLRAARVADPAWVLGLTGRAPPVPDPHDALDSPRAAMMSLTGSASVLVSVALFLAASWSDPGTVHPGRPADLAAWHQLYPPDGALFPPAKECSTCGIVRPARSKHCRVCNKCVGRHDHHCQWINNCVGFNNLRIFLAFLVANLAMCAYGAVLACVILGGEMERRGMFSIQLVNYRTGQVLPLWRVPSRVVEWVVAFHPVASALTLFMGAATLLMAAFLSYQIYLLAVGRTQYEAFKWRDLHYALLEQAEREAAEVEEARQAAAAAATAAAEEEGAARQRRMEQREDGGGAGGAGGDDDEGMSSDVAGGAEGCPAGSQKVMKGFRPRPAVAQPPGPSPSSRSSWWWWRGGAWWHTLRGGGGGGRGVEGGGGGGGNDTHHPRRQDRAAPVVALPPNIYNRGFWTNVWEVMMPELHFERARAAAAAVVGGSPGRGDGGGGGRRSTAVAGGGSAAATILGPGLTGAGGGAPPNAP